MDADLSCQCERHELRTRRIRGGGIQYWRQCLDCGSAVGSAVPHREVDPARLPPYWDEELPAKIEERRRQFWEQRRQQQEQEFDDLREARREEYRRYLLTPEWRERRKVVLERDRYLCQGCLRNRATEVHHKTYAHLGNELFFELVSLCGDCHSIAHADA